MKPLSSRALVFGASLFGATFGLINQSFAIPAWELSSVSSFRNASWSFGDNFTVGGSSISVDALGALDTGMNGFVTPGGIAVGLFNQAGTLLVSTTVTSSSTLMGNYRFAPIAPITLNAGQQYRVVGVNGDDLYNISQGTLTSIDPRVTWNSYSYGQSTTLLFSNDFTGTERSWFANFNIAGPGGTSVPDGGSSIAMAAFAFAGLVALRRSLR
ncbi:MAG: VPDSG-CTERM sorting domain-containing protein [Opitutaceae bacterium]